MDDEQLQPEEHPQEQLLQPQEQPQPVEQSVEQPQEEQPQPVEQLFAQPEEYPHSDEPMHRELDEQHDIAGTSDN